MKVKDLQNQLAQLDPDLDVVCYLDDDAQLLSEKFFNVLEVVAATKGHGEWGRTAKSPILNFTRPHFREISPSSK